MDPLSTYEYSNYEAYIPPTANNMNIPSLPYPYEVKVENPVMHQDLFNHFLYNVAENDDKVMTNLNNAKTTNDKPADLKPVVEYQKKVKKEKSGKKSSYWSEKISDDNFKFYGCSLCSISYATLLELDQHVATHKDRLTSYDLKLKNLIRRKKMKKEQKKLKKLSKIKKEEMDVPEIKPEDGYIGSEKASEYGMNELAQTQSNDKSNDSKENNDGNSSESKDNVNLNSAEQMNLEKIYKCFACQKQFTLSYYLKLHVRSHTDEKPYTCSVCGQSFITASKLGRHNKRIHLAIRYQCRICYRYFSKFENLTTHFDKKHAEDKLEGEPYDYNAILPYLKELEEQLREKEQEKKMKTEDVWDEWGVPSQPAEPVEAKIENPSVPDSEGPAAPLNILIEEVKVDPADVEVKQEAEESMLDDHHADDAGDDDVAGDTRYSDDDYFPSNTWAASPKMEDGPPSPVKGKRGKVDGPLKCEVCNKSISTVSYMRVHMRTHTGEKPFKCYICKRGFITSSKMHRHVLTHNETWEGDEAPVKLEEMKQDVEDGDEPLDKKSRIRKAKAKFNKKTTNSDSPKKHKKRPHACEFCHKRFLHIETLLIHKKSHEGEELEMKCSFCLMVVPDEVELRQHEATHSGAKPYVCTVCGNCYSRRETMIYHRKHHKPDMEYACSVCPKRFTAACKLQRHSLSHRAGRFVLRYECPVCAHMFHTKYHVHMHLATHQREGLILEENRNEILAMVLQNARKIPKQPEGGALPEPIPSDERSRVCNICGEVFQHFYYLEEHLKSHGSKIALEDINKPEEKKHVCTVCNKSFKLHYYLKLHSFTHTKEKPFICQQCGKGFITKGKLKRHLETHTGLKKYQCHICYKYFTRPSYLRIHVRTIHGHQHYNFRLDSRYAGNGLGDSVSGVSC